MSETSARTRGFRIKSLDRFFGVIFVIVSACLVLTAEAVRMQIIESIKDMATNHVQASAYSLVAVVSRDLEEGDFMVAWRKINRALLDGRVRTFLIRDSSGKLLVDDVENDRLFKKLKSDYSWTASTDGRGVGQVTMSTDMSYLHVTKSLQQSDSSTGSVFIELVYDLDSARLAVRALNLSLRGFTVVILLLLLINYLVLLRAFENAVKKINDGVSLILAGNAVDVNTESLFQDYFPTKSSVHAIKSEFERVKADLAANAEEAAIARIARQVAHDIRSPLSALQILSSSLESVAEDKRLLVSNATKRIQEIASGLLAHGKEVRNRAKIQQVPGGRVKLQPLAPLIELIVNEKRLQCAQPGLEIRTDIITRETILAEVDGTEFLRALSNLIDNSMEAIENDGRITVSLREYASEIGVVVSDTGRGIPDDVLANLGQAGVSFGKADGESGSGLGLHHATTVAEQLGGRLSIQSRLGVGTIVSINIPKRGAIKAGFIGA